MKNLFLLLFAGILLFSACAKDDEPKTGADKFVGDYKGAYYEYDCAETLIILNTFNNSSAKIEKQTNTDISCSLKDSDGKTIFDFVGRLKSETSDTFFITSFVKNSLTYTGQGFKKDGKLQIAFGNSGCKVSENTYRISSEFKQN
jgi:hypothetical protein